jgi:predicted RNA-binding protein (TIGR00451 family)
MYSCSVRVIMNDDVEALKCVKEGKSAMCKFVEELDPDLRCGDECVLVDTKDNYIRCGTLMLSPKEIREFKRGMAVRTR